MRFVFDDHEEVYEAGDAFYQPPGHRPYVDAGTELLQFSPTKELAETERAIVEWMIQAPGDLACRLCLFVVARGHVERA